MAFFLIGRGPEDDLRLLSGEFFATRQDAIAKLSSLSGDPSFDQWDTEVFVADLEDGVPVLLVRPQSMQPAQQPPAVAEEPEAADTGDAAAWEADLPAAAEELPVADEPVSQEAETAVAEEPEPVVSDEPAAVQASDVEADELREAILRTTEQMSAEGIVPPESAGLSTEEVPVAVETDEPEAVAEWTAGEAAVSEPVAQAVEPAVAEAGEPAAEPEADVSAEEATEPVWPWAAPTEVRSDEEPAISPDIADVYEALEEPQEAMVDIASPDSNEAGDAMVEPIASAHEPMSASNAEAPVEEGSDFILDLDAIQPVALDDSESETSAPLEVESSQPAVAPVEETYSSLTDYTCADCVYVETCPNRDQRAPKDCGSFQWK